MSAVRIWQGVLLAAVLSATGLLMMFVLPWLVGVGLTLKLFAVLSSLTYIIMLFKWHAVQSGRVFALTTWVALSGVLTVINPGLLVWLAAYTLLFWLLRAGLLAGRAWVVVLDGALCVASLLAAVAAWYHTHSVAWSIWAYFLVQATHPWLPTAAQSRTDEHRHSLHDFDNASRVADAALTRLMH